MLKELYLKAEGKNTLDIESLKKEKESLKQRKSVLLDKYLEGDIEKEIYQEKSKELEAKILEIDSKLEVQKREIPTNLLEKTKEVAELIFDLYRSYSQSSNEKRSQILKKYGVELFLNNKKELQLAESDLLKLTKKLNNRIWWS